MFGLEEKSKKKSVDQRLEELEIQLAAMSKERTALLEEIGASSEEIESFFSNSEHFSEEEWELLQRCQRELDALAEQSSGKLSDPREVERRRRDRVQPAHWIPVR